MKLLSSSSSLLQNFQIFYYEVIRQKEKALRLSEDTISKEESPPTKHTSHIKKCVESIQKKLKLVLEDQKEHQSKLGGIDEVAIFQESQYIMTVLADEIFLNLSWPGAFQWSQSLLENQLFHTQIAGELFFKKLDTLFESSSANKSTLAEIYFLALSLGFKGKFKDVENQERLCFYLDNLYNIIDPGSLSLDSPQSYLMPQCYDYTLNEPPGRGLPDLRAWAWCILGVAMAYIFITYFAWYQLASEMHEDLQKIFEQTKQTGFL